MYQSNINDALKKEKCPDNLIDIKQSLIFEYKEQSNTKNHSTDSNGYDQKKKSTDGLDGIDDGDGNNNGSGTSNQNNGTTPSTGQNETKHLKHHSNNKKSHSKKDQLTDSSDRDRHKKKNPRRPESSNKRDKYNPDGSSDPFLQSGETDNFELGSLSSPFTLQPSIIGHRPTKHMKKPYQSKTESNGSDQYNPNKSGRSDGTDDLDYPDESLLTSQSPDSKGPTKHSDKSQTDSKVDRSDGLDSYESNKNLPLTSDESLFGFGSPDELKRPGRSPSRSGVTDGFNYPDNTDMSLATKRVPRRGDIGIQDLDERSE